MDYSRISDEALVNRIIQDGHTEEFSVLYERYGTKVYNKCLSFSDSPSTAEDLTYKIFLKTFARLKQFKNNSRFSTWFYSLVYNHCIDLARRQYLQEKVDFLEFYKIDRMRLKIFHCDSEMRLLNMGIDELKKYLKKLPPEDRSLLLMKYQDEMNNREIGQILNISENAVTKRLNKARERLITIHDKLLNFTGNNEAKKQ